MKVILLLSLLFSLSFTSAFSQEKVRSVEWKGKTYFLYPYRYDTQRDPYYTYDYNVGSVTNEREIVPYPGNLPDGEYLMYFEPVSVYKKKMWFFHRRGDYFWDSTQVAATFSLRDNQKQGLACYYNNYHGLLEKGNYVNDQKEGEWTKKSFRNFYSQYNFLNYEDPNQINSGTILEFCEYKSGIREGKYRSYLHVEPNDLFKDLDTNGTLFLYSKGNYRLNKEAGTWFYYYKNKSLFKKFTLADSVIQSDFADPYSYTYNAPKLFYEGWHELYYPNGQLQNRILYHQGIKRQLDTGYFQNGKFNWVNKVEVIQEDTTKTILVEYIAYDSSGRITSHSKSKDDRRLWTKTYYGNNLCSEYYDRAYYTGVNNKDTLVVASIYYNCYDSEDPKKISQIEYYHPETGMSLRRNMAYISGGYNNEMDDFEFKSDTTSDIYYVTEIDFQGRNSELEYRTYRHHYRGPMFNFYYNYSMEIDSVVLFHDGKRFNGDYTEYQGRWNKKSGKVKGNDHHLKYYSYYYSGRGFGGTPSFGYNSKKLVISDYGYRGRRFSIRRKLQSTDRGAYQNGLKEGEWTNENKKHGYLNESANFSKGQLEGNERAYSMTYAYKWSNCSEIKDKGISKKKSLSRKYRYYLSSDNNYLNDELHGEQKGYYCNGQLSEKSYFDGGIQTGNYEVYNETGNLSKKTNYNHGFYDGKYQEWYITKKLRYDLNFEEGLLVGEYKSYHYNGNPMMVGNAINGYKDGEWLTYFEEGNLKYKEIFKLEDSTFMSFSSYYIGGAKMPEHSSHTLTSCYSMQYYPSGTLAAEGMIKRNSRTGIWKFYDEGGNRIRQINYEPGFILQKNEKGKMDSVEHFGYYESWYSNGQKQTEAYVLKESTKFDCYQEVSITLQDLYYLNYWDKENNQTIKNKTGRLKSYHLTTGKVESEGEMMDGKKTGYWRYWDPEGKLNGAGNYKNDLENGRWLFGDLEGMHYLDDACFDISDPRVMEDMEMKKKQLSISEFIYLNGEIIKQTQFNVDLNR